jgi:hypothetical protein
MDKLTIYEALKQNEEYLRDLEVALAFDDDYLNKFKITKQFKLSSDDKHIKKFTQLKKKYFQETIKLVKEINKHFLNEVKNG